MLAKPKLHAARFYRRRRPNWEQSGQRPASPPIRSCRGAAAASSGTRFSDLAEMLPLKEPVFAPSVPESVDPPTVVQVFPRRSAENEDKARIQPREIAERAFQQIATVPPRLILFSVLGAMGLILLIAIAVLLHVRSEDDGATAAPKKITAAGPDSTPGPKPPIAHTLAPPKSQLRRSQKRNPGWRHAPPKSASQRTPHGSQFPRRRQS